MGLPLFEARALLRTAPLHAPERLQRLRDADLGAVDVRSLALRVLDVSIGGCALWCPHDVPPLQAGSGELLRMAIVQVPDRARFGGVRVDAAGLVEGFVDPGSVAPAGDRQLRVLATAASDGARRVGDHFLRLFAPIDLCTLHKMVDSAVNG